LVLYIKFYVYFSYIAISLLSKKFHVYPTQGTPHYDGEGRMRQANTKCFKPLN